MSRQRRKHSLKFKRKVAAYVKLHGPSAAARKFDVVEGVARRWSLGKGMKREDKAEPRPVKPGTYHAHLESLSYCKLAHRKHLEEIRSGGDFSYAAVYTWMALKTLQEG